MKPTLSMKPTEVDGGCWRLPHSLDSKGYVHFRRDGKLRLGHRYFFEAANGPVPKGLVLDHLCRNRWCVNPAHLEAVTGKVNILRGVGRGANNARQTHCLRGHPFEGNNLRIYTIAGRPARLCRECNNIRSRAAKARARARRAQDHG